MRYESVFVWGLAFAVAMLISIFGAIIVMALVLTWRRMSASSRSPYVDEELGRKIEEARRGGSQTGDFD